MVLVTGGTGFVGSRLIFDLIENGQKVKAIKRIHSIIPPILIPFQKKILWVDGDVLDPTSLENAMEGVDYVFHCAAFVSLNQKKTELLFKINIDGTSNVINACLSKKIKKVCHISSIAALGKGNYGDLINEMDHWTDSQSAYSISKFFSENEVWRGAAEGLDIVVVNPSVIIGPGTNDFGSGRIIQLFRKGTRFYTSGGNGFVDVRDLCKIMIQLMFSEIKGERFIVSSGNFEYKTLLDIAAKLNNKKKPSILISKNILNVILIISKIFSLITFTKSRINRSNIDSTTEKEYYDNSKIVKALSYSFIPIEKTIADSIHN